MRVYIDEDTTPQLGKLLVGHTVESARSKSLQGTKNGALLKLLAGNFDVIVTRDRNLYFQQNLRAHGIGLVVIRSRFSTLNHLAPLAPAICAAVERVLPGEFIEVSDEFLAPGK